jgi:hypothetical protein
MALAAMRRLTPVGMVDAGSRDLHVEPSLSQANTFHWLNTLRHVAYDEPTRLTARLDELTGYLRTRSLIVVLSDLHDQGSLAAIRRTHQRHDVIVLKIEDPAERGRLRAGLVPAVEAETGRMLLALSGSRWFEKHAEEDDLQSLKDAGVDHLVLATDRDIVVPLRRFLRERGGILRNVR